ncbi:hypothetical protein, partial [Neisseria cinerea]|uniref:hypothetical protein n=1 Tax=Neisseria cinerea TaxID=483 RepID=UPI003556DB7A
PLNKEKRLLQTRLQTTYRTDEEGYIEKLHITPANIPVFSLTNGEKRSPFENRIVSSLYISTKFTA